MRNDIYVAENVYKPAEDTFLIADQIPYYKSRRTLDLGTGCGILALLAAETAEEVVATDLNPHAADCAMQNARLHGLDHKMNVVVGDLFDPIRTETRFDLIIFNPPYLPVSNTLHQNDYLSLAWNGGMNGSSVTTRFLAHSSRYLEKNGNILLVQSSLSGIEPTISKMHRKGFQVDTVARRSTQFEEIAILSCHRAK